MSASTLSSLSHGGWSIILFDAECVLCSASAQFVLKHDKAARFRLASMQGEFGSRQCDAHGVDSRNPDSILVIDGGKLRQDADAVLSICERLGWPWRLVGVLRIVPGFVLDPAYRWVARNRYRLFGKRTNCWLAPPEYRDRIL